MHKISFDIPYMPELSKNSRYLCKSRKIKNPQHKKAQETVYWLCLQGLKREGVTPKPKSKYYISIFWHRSSMRGDVQNFINPIVDSIKNAVGIDDNYAALRWVDWEYKKGSPAKINITVELQGLE